MHIKYINKNIILDNIVSEINLINIEDNVQYLSRSDGILIKGNIYIDCEYISLGVLKKFHDKVDVSILIPLENIIDNEILFKVVDFDYMIKDNILSLSFKINIEGFKEIEKSFQDENKEMEIVSNVDVELEDIEEYLKSEEEIIVLDNENEIKIENDENKINEDIISDNQIDNNVINLEEDEGKRLSFNINGEAAIEYIDTNEKSEGKKSFIESLFKKDPKVKMMKYRVILEEDTYEEIAREYNVNLYKLKEINGNKSLILGNIIKIPSSHE